VEEPLVNKKKIENRLNVIEEIKDDFMLREDLNEILKNVYDIERICGKIAFEKVTPKEMIHLKNSIEKLPDLNNIINSSNANILKKYIEEMDDLNDIYNLIDESIKEDPSVTIKDGNIIKSEFNDELKELRDISKNGAFMIKEIENREREKTGVKSLKIGFNKVFGYFIEITKANLNTAKIDEGYIRKQTLSNAERFITSELKEIEDKILHAEEKIKTLEYEIFVNIRETIYKNIDRIQKVAKTIANIDVFVSFAIVAYMNNYVKPNINENNKLDIKNGRHPVIENIVGEENFVPNDTYLNSGENIINIITGPNMAGKSTYMRQTAIITLMAHIGSFVPAEYANIPICDRIFTRVGASDDLSQGQSTFMVEMSEVSHILKNATDKSLVILDEIGRGTSTYDGISLAWSIVEYIQNNIKCKTLFATHYHELTDLENEFSDVKNYSIAVKEDNEGIVFLRKIIPQGADKSYGIYVAQLAKLPEEVINRSKEILKDLEKNHINNSVAIKKDNIKLNNSYDSIDNVQVDLTSLVNTNMNINEKVNIEKVSNLEKEVEKLKLENNQLAKNYKNVKNDYDKLNKDYNELSENLESSVIRESAITQISFEGINGNDLVEDILELDILSMTPLDAMNALFNLQKKQKIKNNLLEVAYVK
ncbi:MAG: DNA mismatch repair protein MutS, partial [Peptostreptococcaceae bacterium]|nr:DNA mismatch repair protein MutS [Peptostreptococcaceae bacterium]